MAHLPFLCLTNFLCLMNWTGWLPDTHAPTREHFERAMSRLSGEAIAASGAATSAFHNGG
jgi:hypothetical protein